MSHRNNASSIARINQIALIALRLRARDVSLLALVLVLLITNGGAG
jgi:hypothetical protein